MVDFFGAGTGGPQVYKGQDVGEYHKDLKIKPHQFVNVLDHIMVTMKNHGYKQRERDDVLGILWSMKDAVVTVWE